MARRLLGLLVGKLHERREALDGDHRNRRRPLQQPIFRGRREKKGRVLAAAEGRSCIVILRPSPPRRRQYCRAREAFPSAKGWQRGAGGTLSIDKIQDRIQTVNQHACTLSSATSLSTDLCLIIMHRDFIHAYGNQGWDNSPSSVVRLSKSELRTVAGSGGGGDFALFAFSTRAVLFHHHPLSTFRT